MKKHVSASSGSFTKSTAALTPTELIRLENFKILAKVAIGGASTLSQLLGPSEKVITRRTNGLEPIEGPFAFVIEDELKLPANWLSSSKKSDRDVPAETLKILGMTADQVEEHIYGGAHAAASASFQQQNTKSHTGKQAQKPQATQSASVSPQEDAKAVIRVSRKDGKKPLLATGKPAQPPLKDQTNLNNPAPSPAAVAVSNEAIQIQTFKETPVAQNKNDQQTTSFNHISNFSMLCDGRSHKKRVAELSGCTPGNVTQILASESVRPDRMAEIERRLCLPSGILGQKRYNSLSELPQLSVDIFQGRTTTEEGYALLSKQENKTVVKVAPKEPAANVDVELESSAKAQDLIKSSEGQKQKKATQPVQAKASVTQKQQEPSGEIAPQQETKQAQFADPTSRARLIADAMNFAQTASHEDVTRMLATQFNDLKPMVSLAVSAVVGRALTGNMTEAQALQVYSLFVEKSTENA